MYYMFGAVFIGLHDMTKALYELCHTPTIDNHSERKGSGLRQKVKLCMKLLMFWVTFKPRVIYTKLHDMHVSPLRQPL